MKKLILSIFILGASSMNQYAQETVKTLYSGNPVNVTWENTLKIDASEFNEGVNVGNYIYITFSNTTDVIELKSNGVWLPGSRFAWLGEGVEDFRCYLTQEGLSTLKEYGLELCGANFTVSGVSVCDDGFSMPKGAVWGGYFWVDNWNTLEIWKTAFENYSGQRYMDVYLSEDNGDFDGYFMKVLTKWEPETLIANNDQIKKTPSVATIDLQNVDLKSLLDGTDRVMVQANPEGGNPFNITAVVLRNDDSDESLVSELNVINENVDVYNMHGVIVKKNANSIDALEGLPKGIYVIRAGELSKKIFK